MFFGFFILAYFFDSNLLGHETFLYTEPLFISTIFIFISVLMNTVMNFKRVNLIQLFIIVAILILIRSNGVVFIFAPLIVLAIKYRKKNILKLIIAGYFLLFLFLSSINLGMKGYFVPVEFNRYKKVIILNLQGVKNKEKEIADPIYKVRTPKWTLIRENLMEWSTENSSFYYSRIPVLIDEFEDRKNFYAIHPYFTISEKCKEPILKDLVEYRVDHLKKPDINQKNFLYSIHLFNKAHTIFIKNNLVLALFTLPAFLVFILFLRRRKLSNEEFLYLVSVFFYYINILFSTLGHSRFQPRYINTFDVFVYFGLFMLFIMAMNHYQTKKGIKAGEV